MTFLDRKSKNKAAIPIMATELVCVLNKSEKKPMRAGKIVPPTIPIIIKPEMSFLRLGFESKACVNKIENRFELAYPIQAIHM